MQDSTFRLFRRSDPEQFLMGLIHAGRHGSEQNGGRILVRPGELTVYDKAFVDDGPLRAASVVLQIPKRLLPLPTSRVSPLLAVPLPADTGIGRLLAQFLTTLVDLEYSEPDTLRLGHIAVDLAGAVLAHHLDENSPTPSTPAHVMYLRAISFVDRNLHVPDLGPAAIASAHGISVRYLHRIFQLHGEAGVHAYLRSRRLDRCRRDLANPGLDHLTIASIAARWGFSRPADFSRAFRREAGVSPSHYRARSRVLVGEGPGR